MKNFLWALKTDFKLAFCLLTCGINPVIVSPNSLKGRILDSFAKNSRHYFFRFFGGLIFATPVFDKSLNFKIDEIDQYFEKYMPKRGDIIVDAGSFHGFLTAFFCILAGKNGRVISFEPDPENFKKLECNIYKYGLKNIILIKKALSNTNGKALLCANGMSSAIINNCRPGPGVYEVETARLDNELEKIGINKVDFIKMDIEGGEISALLGAEKTLKENSANLAIASYHIVENKKTCFKVEEILKSFGYNSETGFEKHLTTYGWK